VTTLTKGRGKAKSVLRPGKPLGRRILDNWQLYLMLLIPVAITIVYKYIPMYGIQIAFRNYKPAQGFF
jgi:putative aldouronate transport system permease protein